MSNYECDKCNKKFKSYNGCYRHKKRNNCSNVKINCPHCSNCFKYKTNMYRHMKNTCKVLKQNKIEELEELEKIKDQLNVMQEQIAEKDKQIDELKHSKHIQNNINNIHDNININLSINPHGSENLENIDFKKIIQNIKFALQDNNNTSGIISNMVKNVIEIDENKNVYLPNVRANYGLILEDKWIIKDMEKLLNDILLDNIERLDTFVDNKQELIINDIGSFSYEQLKYNLSLYFNKIDNNKKEYDPNEKLECMKKIKEILIANRHLVSAFYEEITGEKIKLPK